MPAPTIEFSAADSAFLAHFASKPNWKAVDPKQRAGYKELRARLKHLAQKVAATQSAVDLRPNESAQNVSGHAAADMWCCVYPAAAGHRSFALQVALIVAAHGAEVCFCLGAGETQV